MTQNDANTRWSLTKAVTVGAVVGAIGFAVPQILARETDPIGLDSVAAVAIAGLTGGVAGLLIRLSAAWRRKSLLRYSVAWLCIGFGCMVVPTTAVILVDKPGGPISGALAFWILFGTILGLGGAITEKVIRE